MTHWLYGHSPEGIIQPSTCVEEFCISPEDDEATSDNEQEVPELCEGKDTQLPKKKSTMTKHGGAWGAQGRVGGSMDYNSMELPTYEDLQQEFKDGKSPPILQLKEGYHY